MKKIVLASLAMAALASPAFAQETAPAPESAPAMTAPAAPTAPEAAPSAGITQPVRVELKDHSLAQVSADGSVAVSKDGGQSWTPAPDGTWEAMDGSKITTMGGKKQ